MAALQSLLRFLRTAKCVYGPDQRTCFELHLLILCMGICKHSS